MMESLYFEYASHVFLLLISTCSRALHIFLSVCELALLVMAFSIQNNDILTREISITDSIAMNLGNSVTASISESELERSHSFFLLMFAIYFHWSCAPPPTTKFIKGFKPIRGRSTGILSSRYVFELSLIIRFST